MSKPKQTWVLVDAKLEPETKRLSEVFKLAGFDASHTPIDGGIRLVVHNKVREDFTAKFELDIHYGDYVVTNLDPGRDFVLYAYTPSIDEHYALAA